MKKKKSKASHILSIILNGLIVVFAGVSCVCVVIYLNNESNYLAYLIGGFGLLLFSLFGIVNSVSDFIKSLRS